MCNNEKIDWVVDWMQNMLRDGLDMWWKSVKIIVESIYMSRMEGEGVNGRPPVMLIQCTTIEERERECVCRSWHTWLCRHFHVSDEFPIISVQIPILQKVKQLSLCFKGIEPYNISCGLKELKGVVNICRPFLLLQLMVCNPCKC